MRTFEDVCNYFRKAAKTESELIQRNREEMRKINRKEEEEEEAEYKQLLADEAYQTWLQLKV